MPMYVRWQMKSCVSHRHVTASAPPVASQRCWRSEASANTAAVCPMSAFTLRMSGKLCTSTWPPALPVQMKSLEPSLLKARSFTWYLKGYLWATFILRASMMDTTSSRLATAT